VSAILFDLDGTLVDSVPDLAAAVNALLAEHGRPPLSPAQVAGMVGDGAPKLVERALSMSGLAALPPAPALARFLALYEANATVLTRPYPDVPEVLATLREAGHRLAICTNKPERATRAVLEGLGLARFFTVVLGGDSLTARKPDPAPLLAALDRLGASRARAAMVGDHHNDVLAAQAAGIAVIFARYGYGGAAPGAPAADAAIDRFSDLPAALRLLWEDRSPSSAR
jgi:phosphoglycolate phosphatase